MPPSFCGRQAAGPSNAPIVVAGSTKDSQKRLMRSSYAMAQHDQKCLEDCLTELGVETTFVMTTMEQKQTDWSGK